MRKVFYGIGIFMVLCLLTLGSYGTYKLSDMRLRLIDMEKELEEQRSVQTDNVQSQIEADTQCTIEEYDKNSGELRQRTKVTSANLLGMNREELTDFLEKSQTPYYTYSLVAFSPEHVVIRQTRTLYETYYLTEEDGKVQVYEGDKETLYEPTEILVDQLPDQLQEEILAGKYLDSEEDLYSFLENYSS